MFALKYLVWRAAKIAASDPKIQAKAVDLYRNEVAPRAKDGWQRAKPAIDEARSGLADAARSSDPVRDPAGFAAKAGAALKATAKHHLRRDETDS